LAIRINHNEKTILNCVEFTAISLMKIINRIINLHIPYASQGSNDRLFGLS